MVLNGKNLIQVYMKKNLMFLLLIEVINFLILKKNVKKEFFGYITRLNIFLSIDTYQNYFLINLKLFSRVTTTIQLIQNGLLL